MNGEEIVFGQLRAAIDRKLGVGPATKERERSAGSIAREQKLTGVDLSDFGEMLPRLVLPGAIRPGKPVPTPPSLYAQLSGSKKHDLTAYYNGEYS